MSAGVSLPRPGTHRFSVSTLVFGLAGLQGSGSAGRSTWFLAWRMEVKELPMCLYSPSASEDGTEITGDFESRGVLA